jgi:hypothetical protein
MKNSGQFKKGTAPYNKGLKRGSVSVATEFKAGSTPANFKGIGTPSISGRRRETLTATEETIRCKSRGREYTCKRRTTYARFIWTKEYGAIPKGMIIFNNSFDPEIILIENLEQITRSELLKRNINK